MSFRPPKGTDDIGAPESALWRDVLRQWDTWAERFGYPLVMTPIFEATDLFERGVGANALLRHWACDPVADARERSAELRLGPDLVVTAHCRVIAHAHQRGAVVVLTPSGDRVRRNAATAAGPRRTTARAHGSMAVARGRASGDAGPTRPVQRAESAFGAGLPLVLVGERGTGKTTLARHLHETTGAQTIFEVTDWSNVWRDWPIFD